MGKIRCPKRGGCNTKRSQRPSTLSRQNKPGIINWWPRMSSKRQFYLSPRNLTGWQTDQCDRVGMKLLGLVRFIRTASVPHTWAIPVWLPNIKQGIKAAHGYAVHPWKKQTVDDRHTATPTSQMGNEVNWLAQGQPGAPYKSWEGQRAPLSRCSAIFTHHPLPCNFIH